MLMGVEALRLDCEPRRFRPVRVAAIARRAVQFRNRALFEVSVAEIISHKEGVDAAAVTADERVAFATSESLQRQQSRSEVVGSVPAEARIISNRATFSWRDRGVVFDQHNARRVP